MPTTTAPGQTMPPTTEPAPTTTAPRVPDDGAVALLSADGLTCYLLGPVLADGSDLMGARAELTQEWIVRVEPRPESVAALDAAFDSCFDGDRACPGDTNDEGHGALAVVLDESVLSSPMVERPDVPRAGFVISGGFDEAQATELAELISG